MMGQLLAGDQKSPGSRAYLGTIPDYSTLMSPNGPGGGGEPGGGVKLAGTRPGSPADRAGVRAGDVLTGIDESQIRTLEEFTLVLTKLKPGDQVELKIRRGDSSLKLPATIGSREGPAPEGAHP
jgi:S1-C subfamily serine protease